MGPDSGDRLGMDYFLLGDRNLVQRQGDGAGLEQAGCTRQIGAARGSKNVERCIFLLPILVGPERIFGRAGWIRMGAFSCCIVWR